MFTRSVPAVSALLFVLSLLAQDASAQRSFVGKRLTGATFVDTEGHNIDPGHYKGSVLVMFGGIPW